MMAMNTIEMAKRVLVLSETLSRINKIQSKNSLYGEYVNKVRNMSAQLVTTHVEFDYHWWPTGKEVPGHWLETGVQSGDHTQYISVKNDGGKAP